MRYSDPDAARASILIVDDDPIAIQALRRALDAYSDVRFATNGADALRLARERPPGLILLDAEMPGQHGFEICRTLKADPELGDVPVIFVTAHDDIEFERKAMELGASDFLPKPAVAPRVQLRVRLHLQLKEQMDQMRALATTDFLTRLANRRAVDEALANEWRRAQRTQQPLSVLLIDVDYFKRFNDTYGHQAGDMCLQRIAQEVQAVARRPTDLAGRFGGEEFILILAATDTDGAKVVAEELREAVAHAAIPHLGSGAMPHVTISIGVAATDLLLARESPVALRGSLDTVRTPGEDDLVHAADQALYLAKAAGRNQVRCITAAELAA